MVENRDCTGCVYLEIEKISLPRGLSAKKSKCLIGEDCYAGEPCMLKEIKVDVDVHEPRTLDIDDQKELE